MNPPDQIIPEAGLPIGLFFFITPALALAEAILLP